MSDTDIRQSEDADRAPTPAADRKPPNRSRHKSDLFPFFHDIRGRVTRWDVETEGWRDPPHPGDGWGEE